MGYDGLRHRVSVVGPPGLRLILGGYAHAASIPSRRCASATGRHECSRKRMVGREREIANTLSGNAPAGDQGAKHHQREVMTDPTSATWSDQGDRRRMHGFRDSRGARSAFMEKRMPKLSGK